MDPIKAIGFDLWNRRPLWCEIRDHLDILAILQVPCMQY
jgi:hypothetical protein